MIGPLTQSTTIKDLENRQYSESQMERKLRDLKLRLEELEGLVTDIKEEVVTENLIADKVNSTETNTQYLESKSILTDTIKAKEAEIESLIIDLIETKEVKADKFTGDLYGQLLNYQDQIDTNSIFANKGEIQEIESNKVKTDLLETINLTLEILEATQASIGDLVSNTGKITELESTSIETETLKANSIETEELEATEINSTSIKATDIETEDLEADKAEVKLLDAPEQIGKIKLPQLEANPDLPTEDNWYTLRVKKGVDFLSIGITDEVDLKLISSYSGESKVAKHSTLVVLHQKQLHNVQLISEDDDYYYIELSPPVGESEIEYRYQSRDIENPLDILHTTTRQSYTSYYAPVKLGEIIVFGNSKEGDESFQFTVLGKLWAKISPEFKEYKFDSIHIAHNIFTKDYYDEELEDWVPKKGNVNDYLSNIEETFDEVTQEWVTRVDWRERIHLREPEDYTEPTTEDTVEEETGRRIKPEADTLMDVGTLRHYNGQWITEQPQPTGRFLPPYTIVYENTEYSNIPDNEWTVLFSDPMDFSTRPELDKTIAAKVRVTDYGQTKEVWETQYKKDISGADLVDFLVTNRGWTKTQLRYNATLFTAPYTEDDGWEQVIYQHKSGESNYHLITQIRIEEDGSFLAYSGSTYINSYPEQCIYRQISRTSTGIEVTGTVEKTGGSTDNPITKLGVVDEGTWVAGDVTTPNLIVKDSMEVKPQSIKWHNKDYQVWLDGEDPTDSDLDWVEV